MQKLLFLEVFAYQHRPCSSATTESVPSCFPKLSAGCLHYVGNSVYCSRQICCHDGPLASEQKLQENNFPPQIAAVLTLPETQTQRHTDVSASSTGNVKILTPRRSNTRHDRFLPMQQLLAGTSVVEQEQTETFNSSSQKQSDPTMHRQLLSYLPTLTARELQFL